MQAGYWHSYLDRIGKGPHVEFLVAESVKAWWSTMTTNMNRAVVDIG